MIGIRSMYNVNNVNTIVSRWECDIEMERHTPYIVSVSCVRSPVLWNGAMIGADGLEDEYEGNYVNFLR